VLHKQDRDGGFLRLILENEKPMSNVVDFNFSKEKLRVSHEFGTTDRYAAEANGEYLAAGRGLAEIKERVPTSRRS
jgi:hypothetical protein